MKARRAFFTLLELLIAILIISTTAMVVAFGGGKIVESQRFRTAVDLIADKLQVAQDLMLMMDTDVTVTLEKSSDQPKTVICTVHLDTPLNPLLAKTLHSESIIQGIEAFAFVEGRYQEKTGKIELKFYAGGSKMAKGVLQLSGDASLDEKGALYREIHLIGMPRPIVVAAENFSKDDLKNSFHHERYPQEILEEQQ